MLRAGIRYLLNLAIAAASASVASAQCSMCRATLLTSKEGQALIGGLRQGTVLLLAVPFVIVTWIAMRVRRAVQASAQELPEQPTDDQAISGEKVFES